MAIVHTLGNLFTNVSLGKVAVSFTHTIKVIYPEPRFWCAHCWIVSRIIVDATREKRSVLLVKTLLVTLLMKATVAETMLTSFDNVVICRGE